MVSLAVVFGDDEDNGGDDCDGDDGDCLPWVMRRTGGDIFLVI